MTVRLTVVMHIILGVFFGAMLAVLPWASASFGLGDWGDNYFLLYAAQKLDARAVQTVIASGWVRGAVTGLGLLSLGSALWDAAHFRRAVRELEADAAPARRGRDSELRADLRSSADLPDNERTPRP